MALAKQKGPTLLEQAQQKIKDKAETAMKPIPEGVATQQVFIKARSVWSTRGEHFQEDTVDLTVADAALLIGNKQAAPIGPEKPAEAPKEVEAIGDGGAGVVDKAATEAKAKAKAKATNKQKVDA